MTEYDEKLYGLFGFVVTTLTQKRDSAELGRSVKEVFAKNDDLGLLLFMGTGMTVDGSLSDEKLGSQIQLKSRFQGCSLVALGMKLAVTLEEYPAQEEMLKALTGYDFKELVEMLYQYEDKSRIFKAFYLEEKDCAGLFVHSFDREPINHEINWPSMLKYYEKGDKVDPHMAQALGKSRQFLDTTLKEEEFSNLMKADAQYRCEWLIKHNHYMMLRDKDWEKIFTDIEQHPESFGRYYPVCRVRMESMSLVEMGTALLINDALYEYSGELATKETEE